MSSFPTSFLQGKASKLPQTINSFVERGISLFSGKGAQQGYLAAADQGIISLTNFVAAILLGRAIEPQEFGIYAVGFLMTRFVRAIQDGLIVQPLSALGAVLDDRGFQEYAANTGILQIILAVISAIAVASLGWVLTVLGNDVAGPTATALWFVLLTWQLQEFIRRAFYTRSEVHKAVINTALASAVRLSLLWWMGSQAELNGKAGLDVIGWGAVAAILFGLWQARDYWRLGNIHLWQTFKRNWKFGGWIMGSSLVNWIASELYPLLAAGLISFAAAGAYRALQNLVAPVHVLLRATDTFFTPRASKVYFQSGYPGLGRILKIIYLVAGVPILGLLVIASLFPEPLLRLLYGETYIPYSGSLFLMAIYYGLWYAYWPLQTAFKAIRLTRPIFIANIAAIICMFTIGIWAIQRFDIDGAIGGQALNAFVISLVLWTTWLRVRRSNATIPKNTYI
ncbi:lipopolysaccharide biosynthesis protein [Chloroflexota bacterium]